MSNKVSTQIQCLQRLAELTSGVDEMLLFLIEEKFIKFDEAKGIRSSPVPAKEMQGLLTRLSTAGSIQLLEYEWILLPIESIKITLVTELTKREFTYSTF